MANLQELKARMKSVQDTQKITNAMYLIASNELRKAKRDLEHAHPYFDAVRTEIKRVFRTLKDIDHPYVYPKDIADFSFGTYGILIITSDKSLAGTYNQNVIKEALKLIKSHKDVKLFVVGEYGRNYFLTHQQKIVEDFHYSPAHATLDEAREITDILLQEYNEQKISKIFVIYTTMLNPLEEETKSTRLLPFHRDYFDDSKQEKQVLHEFEFVPSPEKVLNNVIESYIQGFIYGALVDSFTSEENARIKAMNQANENAKEIIENLAIERNQIRQANITEEINEVSAGAKAQQKERKQRRKD